MVTQIKPTLIPGSTDSAQVNRMKMFSILSITLDESTLRMLYFLNTCFRNSHGHHKVGGKGFYHEFTQGNMTNKGQLIAFPIGQLRLNFIDKITKVFDYGFFPVIGTSK